MSAAKKINFTISPEHIIEVIEGQTDGLDKAFGELVMNSVDAKARYVNIRMYVNDNKNIEFTFEDNGRGFAKTDILKYFKVFGQPHKEGDATFGKFRMGRSQILYYARTKWYTRKYQMNIDLYEPLKKRNIKSLGFDLLTRDEHVQGCKIHGVLYRENIDLYCFSIDSFKSELKELIQYIDMPVLFNGELITTSVKDIKKGAYAITHEDEVAYYFMDHNCPELLLYNQGVLVEYNDLFDHLAKGIIITKTSLNLDHSRRTVLTERCKVYAQIKQTLSSAIDQKFLNNFDEKDVDLDSLVISTCRHILENYDFSYNKAIDVIMNRPIFTDFRENDYRLKELMDLKKITFSDGEDVVVIERIERIEQTLIIDKNEGLFYRIRNLNSGFRGGVENHKNIVNFFNKIARSWLKHHGEHTHPNYVDFEYLDIDPKLEKYQCTNKAMDTETLNQSQKQILGRLVEINDVLFATIPYMKELSAKRTITLGTSEEALAWTNGTTDIWFNVAYVEKKLKEGNVLAILTTYIHEYCHKADSKKGHDFLFYLSFHEYMSHPSIQKVLEKCMRTSAISCPD